MVEARPKEAKAKGTVFWKLVATHLARPAVSNTTLAAKEVTRPYGLPLEVKAPPMKKTTETDPPARSEGMEPLLM